MLREINTNVTVQGKILESFESKRLKYVYYTKISTGDNFQELYLKQQLEVGTIYNIKGKIKFGSYYNFVEDPVITKIN